MNIKFNKYQNEFILHTTRKNKTKKPYINLINTRVRKEIKKIIRTKKSENIFKKKKYDMYNKYISKISAHSYNIIKTKAFRFEKEKKMMIQMIHQSLPVCEKINRLVSTEEKNPNNNGFFKNKYEKVTNNGLCPCCNMHSEYENENIEQIRNQLPGVIGATINKYILMVQNLLVQNFIIITVTSGVLEKTSSPMGSYTYPIVFHHQQFFHGFSSLVKFVFLFV